MARKLGAKLSGTAPDPTGETDSVNRLVYFTDYNNLEEPIRQYIYIGDTTVVATGSNGFTVTLASSGIIEGVATKPGSGLRTDTIVDRDDQGRIYSTQQLEVAGSGQIRTRYFYDERGQVIQISQPTDLKSEFTYDGAGRLKTTYLTDGGNSYSGVGSPTGDNVYEQVERTYDDNGNLKLVATRKRFDNESTTGALGDQGTAPTARVSFVSYHYDDANRLTDMVDVGTNYDSAIPDFTKHSTTTVPSRGPTALVTSFTYEDHGWKDSVTDPRNATTAYDYDDVGRVIKTIENVVDSTMETTDSTEDDDRTTEWTYDGSDHVLTMKAHLAGGAFQTTEWIYDATTAGGSDVNSKDVLTAINFPDSSSGAASSSEQELYKVNALDETKFFKDRRLNEHDYAYDVLGRLTSDTVSTLGSGVDNRIRRLGYTFDDAGRPHKLTSYSNTGGTTTVNQIERTYNGFGQILKEYQEHVGSVVTADTPYVEYGYIQTENASLPRTVEYPNQNQTIRTIYDGVGRIWQIQEDIPTGPGWKLLEEYTYLGFDTVAKQTRTVNGSAGSQQLTYIDASSTGEAGDKYVGLDRFDRVVDQRWMTTSGSVDTDRYKYAYDENGNRLFKDNTLNNSFDELYHPNGATAGYDKLNRMTAYKRGSLSDANVDGTYDTVASASPNVTYAAWMQSAIGSRA